MFDVGRVLVKWDLRCLFAKMIDDPAQREWFVTHVVTENWHYQHDAGRDLETTVAERKALYPEWADAIDAYATRFMETIPGDVPGTTGLVHRLADAGHTIFGLTNFAAPFWAEFRPTRPVFDRFSDIVVSGVEKLAKPDPAIYALAQRRFGRAPDDLFFIDDNADNIASAKAAGWGGHLFTDASALERQLVSRGYL